jgi:hypothetical protein
VEFNGQYMGVTPLTLTYDRSFFEGKGMWVWSRYLNVAVSMSVSADGCATQTMVITRGPFNWQNMLGTETDQYYVFAAPEFDVKLNCAGLPSEPRPQLAGETQYWESVDKTDPAELRLYLDKYPQGQFADLAKAKLARLTGSGGGGGELGTSDTPMPALSEGPLARVPRNVTLQIQSGQGSLIEDAQKLVAFYCLSHRLALVQARSTMDLEVTVGDKVVAFRQNGSKAVEVEAADQSYNISGKISMVFGARDMRGGQSTITLTDSFLGDGTIHLSENDAGQTIPLRLIQVSSRVVAMDLSSGQGETEITLSLRR